MPPMGGRFPLRWTEAQYRAAEEEMRGYCVSCGARAEGAVEPDANRYRCGWCKQDRVAGVETLLESGRIEIRS